MGWIHLPYGSRHEIAGHVSKVGKNVKKFKVGDLAGVGCLLILAVLAQVAKRSLNSIAK